MDQASAFQQLGLEIDLCAKLTSLNFVTPTEIQNQAIPMIANGYDLIGLAQTGTGKTGAFMLPYLNLLQKKIKKKYRNPTCLVLEPTRELAQQVVEQAKIFDPNLKVILVTGGDLMGPQQRQLKKPFDMIVATPGRLLDFLNRGELMLFQTPYVVIDEADKMLDMGFVPDIESILGFTSPSRQTVLFSATMKDEIHRLSQSFMRLPRKIQLENQNNAKVSIDQYFCKTENDSRLKTLTLLLESKKLENGVIFCNRKTDVDLVCNHLAKQGFRIAAVHGGYSQDNRNDVIEKLKSKQISILVASDVVARGIDIPSLSFVINYNLPIVIEDYVHRIGRTGRAGQHGIAVSLVTKAEQKKLQAIEEMQSLKLLEIHMQSATEKISSQKPLHPKAVNPSQNTTNPRVKGFGDNTPAFMLPQS